jgi:glycosyltransferase EpsF
MPQRIVKSNSNSKNVLHIIYKPVCGGIENLVLDIVNNDPLNICFVFFLSGKKGELSNNYEKTGIIIGYSKAKTLFSKAQEISKFINSNSIDIVHNHSYGSAHIILLINLLNQQNVKFVETIHNMYSMTGISFSKRLINEFISILIYKKRICVSEAVQHDLFVRTKSVVIPNGIKMEKKRFSIEEKHILLKEFQISKHDFIVLIVGSLSPQKNHIFALKVADHILNNQGLNNIHFVFCGEGVERSRLKRIVNEKNLDNVSFLGNSNNVPLVYEIAHLLFVPSLFEGFSLVTLEAAAQNLPILANDIKGLSWAKGLLSIQFYSHDDIAFVAKAIIDFKQDYENKLMETSALNKKNIQKFDLINMLNKYQILYDS